MTCFLVFLVLAFSFLWIAHRDINPGICSEVEDELDDVGGVQ